MLVFLWIALGIGFLGALIIAFVTLIEIGPLNLFFLIKDGQFVHELRRRTLTEGDEIYVREIHGPEIYKCVLMKSYHAINKYEVAIMRSGSFAEKNATVNRNRLIHPKHLKDSEKTLYLQK